MSFPTKAEIEAMQDKLAVMHKQMHAWAKEFPANNVDFVAVAVNLTDASRKLDKLAQDSDFVAKRK